MTNDELYRILKKNRGWETDTETVLKLIWGQPFDGETEKIKPTTEESSAVLSESFRDGTTYTRSYQVFLPTPKPTLIKSIFSTPNPTQPNQ